MAEGAGLSEAEVRTLYVTATEAGRAFADEVEGRTRALWGRIDLGLWLVGAAVALGLGVVRGPIAFAQTVALLGLAIWVSLAVLGVSGPAGLFGKLGLAGEFGEAAQRQVDPTDPEVLIAVIDHLAHGPLDEGRAIVQRLARERRAVGRSREALRRVQAGFEEELQLATEADLRAAVSSRLEQAGAAARALEALEADLIALEIDVEDALKPLQAAFDRFDRLRGLTDELAGLQRDHGLAEPTPATPAETRARFDALVSAGREASAALVALEDRSLALTARAERAAAQARTAARADE